MTRYIFSQMHRVRIAERGAKHDSVKSRKMNNDCEQRNQSYPGDHDGRRRRHRAGDCGQGAEPARGARTVPPASYRRRDDTLPEPAICGGRQSPTNRSGDGSRRHRLERRSDNPGAPAWRRAGRRRTGRAVGGGGARRGRICAGRVQAGKARRGGGHRDRAAQQGSDAAGGLHLSRPHRTAGRAIWRQHYSLVLARAASSSFT
jgi:hypothetical protein